MFTRKTQRGQALGLIAVAIVAMLAVTALAIDAGNAFDDRRHAQSAADNAALAVALAKVGGASWEEARAAGIDVAAENGYSQVAISSPPGAGCNGQTPTIHLINSKDQLKYYVLVVIKSSVDTYFGPIIGVNKVENCVQAIARARPPQPGVPFDGNAVVGLASCEDTPGVRSIDSGQSAASRWIIEGGGIFANCNAHSKSAASISFPDGGCVSAVGSVSGTWSCTPTTGADAYDYPEDIEPMMPPEPECNGMAYLGEDGKIHEQPGYEGKGSRVDSFPGDYAPGVYCITNADGNVHTPITGVGVTFYIMDTDFTLRFNGGGYLGASAPTSGIYKGLLIFGPITPTPCTQNLMIRGNGGTPIIGTIWLPSACIDYRGNGQGNAIDSLVVGYKVTSNGTADLRVKYNPENNYKAPLPPLLELTK